MSEVVNYAQAINRWMKASGREEVARHLGLRASAQAAA
jgi:hypothetical protein